jgi:predicted nuclease of predicted toxin-antitoxin system
MTRSISETRGLIRLPDPDIAAKAVAEGRIVLTFDLDFGDILVATHGAAPSVVVFRLRNQTPAGVNPRLFRVIEVCAPELVSGAIVIVEDDGFRVRRLPIRP